MNNSEKWILRVMNAPSRKWKIPPRIQDMIFGAFVTVLVYLLLMIAFN